MIEIDQQFPLSRGVKGRLYKLIDTDFLCLGCISDDFSTPRNKDHSDGWNLAKLPTILETWSAI